MSLAWEQVQTHIFLPCEDCQGMDRAVQSYIPPVNHGTCIAYQDYIGLQFILAQIASILMYSKNKGKYDTNIKKFRYAY